MRWLSMFLLGVSWFKILHSSLTHFEFIFEYGATKCSSFILLHEKKFSQKHLWKRLSFLHCIFLSPLSQINATYESRFISGLYSVPWIWVAVLGPVPYYWLFGAFYGSIVFFFFFDTCYPNFYTCTWNNVMVKAQFTGKGVRILHAKSQRKKD